jgi:uncharacterized protein
LAKARDLFNEGQLDVSLRMLSDLAGKGYAPAQVFLGWTFEVGKGGPPDLKEATRWYEAAARTNDAVGAYYLGCLISRERGEDEGLRWIERAADQGYAPALYRLGRLYLQLGSPEAEVKALDHMRRAAELGHPFAKRWLAIRGLKGLSGVKGFVSALKWFLCAPRLAWKMIRGGSDENLLVP